MRRSLPLMLVLSQVAWINGCGRSKTDSGASLNSAPQGDAAEAEVIFADGASNTAGLLATFPFGERLRYHFKSNGLEMGNLLHGKKVFFSLDYFFPTNFPEYLDASVSAAQLQSLVNSKLDALAAQYDYLVMMDLFDKDEMTGEYQRLLNQSDHANLDAIYSALTPDEHGKQALHAINAAMRAYAKAHPGTVVAGTVQLANYLAVNGSYNGYKASKLFADPVHLNDAGQAAVFNVVFINAMSRIPELEHISIPQMPLSYDSSWKETLIRTISLGKEGFVALMQGEYWGKIQNFGTWSNPFSKPRFQKDGARSTTERLATLDAIRSKISWASMAAPAEHFVTLETRKGGDHLLGLDLRRVLFFTNIKLAQPDPSHLRFVGYGFDHWLSVDGDPSTNYKFEVSVDASDRALLHVVWTVYPMLEAVDGGATIREAKRPAREGILAQQWIDEIERNGSSYPRLVFNYDVRID